MEHQNENGDFVDKKQLSLTLIVIITLMLILFFTSFFMMNNRISTLHEAKSEQDSPVFNDTPNVTEETEYLIKEFENKIGIYKNGDFQYLLDVYVFTLPEYDKKLLHQGITVSSEQELTDILSSYY